VGGSEKSRFLVLRWGCRLEDGVRGTADAWSDHHCSHACSQVLTRNVCILILSPAEIFSILSEMSNYRIIFEKKNCLF